MSGKMNLTVGQEVVIVTDGRRMVTNVSKVGRKWVTFTHSSDRLNLETGRIDHRYGIEPEFYESITAHDSAMQRKQLWQEIRGQVERRWRPPSFLTTHEMHSILEMLKRWQPQAK